MNSTISDDLNREHVALEAAKCLQTVFLSSQRVTTLHKELLEINLSFTTYIEESKRRLEGLRLELANEAQGSHKVVEVLSKNCKITSMSISPITSKSCKMSATRHRGKLFNEDNNNTRNKSLERQQARTFITWYKQMLDNERHNFALYLSDDASLEWFGRTIKTRKKVTAFLKHDMQCSRHDFTTVESIEKIESRQDRLQRTEDSILASPLNSPELLKPKNEMLSRKRGLRSNCGSPEWADGCQPQDEIVSIERKRLKTSHIDSIQLETNHDEPIKHSFREESSEITNKGDNSLSKRSKRNVSVTPPNKEIGQGDCLPSTSGTDSDRSHDALNAQLQKLAVECNGYIDFTRTRNNRNVDSMKWARKCKVQISYSEDPLNVGEYIIWALRYTDESKCRRNLMAAFNEVSDEVKKI